MKSSTTLPTNGTSPLLVDSRTAAKMLGVSERTLWELTQNGTIPFVPISQRCKRYSVIALEQWIKDHTQRMMPNVITSFPEKASFASGELSKSNKRQLSSKDVEETTEAATSQPQYTEERSIEPDNLQSTYKRNDLSKGA